MSNVEEEWTVNEKWDRTRKQVTWLKTSIRVYVTLRICYTPRYLRSPKFDVWFYITIQTPFLTQWALAQNSLMSLNTLLISSTRFSSYFWKSFTRFNVFSLQLNLFWRKDVQTTMLLCWACEWPSIKRGPNIVDFTTRLEQMRPQLDSRFGLLVGLG